MQALLPGEPEFSGKDICYGHRGGDSCQGVLHFSGHATYSDERPQAEGKWRA